MEHSDVTGVQHIEETWMIYLFLIFVQNCLLFSKQEVEMDNLMKSSGNSSEQLVLLNDQLRTKERYKKVLAVDPMQWPNGA